MSQRLAFTSHLQIALAIMFSIAGCTDTPNVDGYTAPFQGGGPAGPMAGAAGMTMSGGAGGMSGGMSGGMGGSGGMAPSTNPLEITTDKGAVTGVAMDGVRVFKGIPFAAPPSGENRFKSPQPVTAWTTPRDASMAGGICPQIAPSTRMFTGDEDCLYLNVFAPEAAPATPLPVMVWFHGGAFVFGSGSDMAYDGKHLVKRGNVVIVTVNYRLGALGYLAHAGLTGDAAAPSGNYGLLDQRAALTWVKNNIAAFGGDAANVTIFGESAGGRSVCWHLMSTGSHGLFHRAIIESGFCNKPTYSKADAEAQGTRFATAVGCTDAAMAATCLRGKTSMELVMASQSMNPTPGGLFYQDRMSGFAFEPTIDGLNITAQPAAILAGGTGVAAVPVLQGANSDEGVLFHVSALGNVVPVMTEQEYVAALAQRYGMEAAAMVVAQYPVADYDDANKAIIDASGDGVFLCPARQTAKLLAARTGASTYLYNFSVPLAGIPLPDLVGFAFHSGELPFVWGNPYALGSIPPDKQAIADALQDRFLQFARTGDPNPMGAMPAWPAYTAENDTLLSFGDMVTTVMNHRKEQCDFWETVPPRDQP
jgi:para-nitrobenzyl esterase